MKEQSRILGFEDIEPQKVADMVRDFKDQTRLNPRIKNAVGQYRFRSRRRMRDPLMTQIACEYMGRMGIRINVAYSKCALA